jgi:hypothetical protein
MLESGPRWIVTELTARFHSLTAAMIPLGRPAVH